MTLDSTAWLLDMLVAADDTSFADVEQIRKIAEYDGLLEGLAGTRTRLAEDEQSPHLRGGVIPTPHRLRPREPAGSRGDACSRDSERVVDEARRDGEPRVGTSDDVVWCSLRTERDRGRPIPLFYTVLATRDARNPRVRANSAMHSRS